MRVAILMSTYQGERFVAQQLASILEQLPADGSVLIRDDGSTDGTVAVIESANDARVTVVRGENIGFVRSFFALLDHAPGDADVIMLADQDDIWLPGKVGAACQRLSGKTGIPTLYCSRMQLVDDQLRPLGLSPRWTRPPSFHNELAENIVTGCTAALNRPALELVRQCGDPSLIGYHDWWMYLAVSAFGEVIHDPQPSMLYRQHGGNAIGMGAGAGRYARIVRMLRKTNWIAIMYRQAGNFRVVHGARMTVHQRHGELRCHHCGHVERVPRHCP